MAVKMSAIQDVKNIIVQFTGLPADKSYSYDLYSIDEDGDRILEVDGGTDEDVYLLKSSYSGTLKFEANVYNAESQLVDTPQTQITIVDLVEVRTATKGTTLNFNLGIFDTTVQSQAKKYLVQFTDASGNPIGKAVTAKIYGDTATATSSVKLNGDVHYTITAVDSAKQTVGDFSGNSTAIDGVAPKAGKLTLKQEAQDKLSLTVSGFSDDTGITQYRYSFAKDGGGTVFSPGEVITVDGTVGAKVTVYVTAFDAAGNSSKIVSKSIKIKDQTAPICVDGKITDAAALVTTKGTTLSFAESNFSDNVKVKKYTVTFYSDAAYTAQVGKAITVSAKKGAVSATCKTQFGEMAYYRVVAMDAAKNSSDAIYGQVVAVDGVAPKAGKVALNQSSQTQVSVSLQGFSDNKGITQYQYSFSKNGEYKALAGEVSTIDVDTAPNKKVTVYVRALDAAGNVSKVVSKSLKIADWTAPDQVKNITISAVSAKNVTTFTWDIPYDNVGVTRYNVWIDGVAYSTKKNTLDVKNLLDGEHTVVVSAQDKAGNVGEAGSATLIKGVVATPEVTSSGEQQSSVDQPSSVEQKSITEQQSGTGETSSGDQKSGETGKEITIGKTGYTQKNLPDFSDITGTAYADKVTVAQNSFAHVENVALGAGDDQLLVSDGACAQIDDLDFGTGNDQLTIGSGSTVWLNADVNAASFEMSVGEGSTLYLAGNLLNYAQLYAGSWSGVTIEEWAMSNGGLPDSGEGDDPYQTLASK